MDIGLPYQGRLPQERILRRWWRPRTKSHAYFTGAHRTIIIAQGKALALLTTALHARGAIDMDDFADTLAVFSAVVAEEHPSEGDVLGVWSAILKDSL